MKPAPAIIATLIGALLLAGCASPSASLQGASPISANPSLSLDSILVQTSSSLPGLDAEKRTLGDAIVSGLNETGLFTEVSTIATNLASTNVVRIQADIKAIKKVSPDAREWVGTWAGQAQIQVHVTVSAAGEKIETFEAEGKSGKSAWAGTTDEAIRLAAGQIVAEITRINSKTAQ
jgi:hypothetical protein